MDEGLLYPSLELTTGWLVCCHCYYYSNHTSVPLLLLPTILLYVGAILLYVGAAATAAAATYVNPENIVVDNSTTSTSGGLGFPRVKLLDFGLSKHTSREMGGSAGKTFVGTPCFISSRRPGSLRARSATTPGSCAADPS